MRTYSTETFLPMIAEESFEGSDAASGDGVETVFVAGMELSLTRKTYSMLATATAVAQQTLDEIAHRNAGVSRLRIDRLQQEIQSKLASTDDWPDKVKDLSELVSGLTAKENAAKALKNVSANRKPVEDITVDLDGSRGVAAGDFQFEDEVDDEAGVFKLRVYDAALANDDEYSVAFVQVKRFNRSIGDYFVVLHRRMPEARHFIQSHAGLCTIDCAYFVYSHRVQVTVYPIATSLPSTLDTLSECFEAKKRHHEADELLRKIIVAKDAAKKKLTAEVDKLRDDNKEKDRKLEEARAEIEVLKQQLTDWQHEVIEISERIKAKGMPTSQRVTSTSSVSIMSTSIHSDFDTTVGVFAPLPPSEASTIAGVTLANSVSIMAASIHSDFDTTSGVFASLPPSEASNTAG
ncbi:hypothetical protein AAVH_10538 [Aphelenchoides avenae]|nr:hypothetical protein AAVH_10538 [Aphelenchus avenae]